MISIIIPVYNIEHYVANAVNSVLAQSYSDWEIILVDDGSTDNSPAICNNFAHKDSRIKAIHKQNGGLSSARNAGINKSEGDYVLLLDGDDYVHPEMFRLLNEVAEMHPNMDFLQFRYKEVEGYYEEFENIEIKDIEIVTSEEEMFTRLYDLGGVAASACTKFYRRSILNKVQFKEGVLHEDEEFTTRLLANSQLVGYCSCEFYYYVMRQGSIIHTNFTPAKMDAVSALEQRIDYLKMKGYYDLMQMNEARLTSMLVLFYQLSEVSGNHLQSIQIKEKFNSIKVLRNPYINPRIKFIGLLNCSCDGLKWYNRSYRLVKSIKQKVLNAKIVIQNEYVCWKHRRKLRHKDFTIISNNCWGGVVYQYFGLPYNSPTIGLFIMDDDYIKFLERFEYYISQPLRFIDFKSSRYHDYLAGESTAKSSYPIGMLDDVEIHFLHYRSQVEAEEKWTRRCARINRNNMLVKMSQRYVCSDDILSRFDALTYKNKICFTEADFPKPGFIKIEELKQLNIQGGDETPFVMKKVDLVQLINNMA